MVKVTGTPSKRLEKGVMSRKQRVWNSEEIQVSCLWPTADIWGSMKLCRAMVPKVWIIHSWGTSNTLLEGLLVPSYYVICHFHCIDMCIEAAKVMYGKTADDLVRIKTMAPNCTSHKDILHCHTSPVKKEKRKKNINNTTYQSALMQ